MGACRGALALMKHVLGLMSDIVTNGLGKAFFIRVLLPLLFILSLSLCLCTYWLALLFRT
jgi:hypothetical protein